MNIEALTQLRRVVEAAPEELFHMRSVVEKSSCGTARCAFGWALIDPWFAQNTNIAKCVEPHSHYMNSFYIISYAAAELFDILQINVDRLLAINADNTMDPHAISCQEVIDNIDRLLAGHPAESYRAMRYIEGAQHQEPK